MLPSTASVQDCGFGVVCEVAGSHGRGSGSQERRGFRDSVPLDRSEKLSNLGRCCSSSSHRHYQNHYRS
jgi:hypothetical protein